MSGQYWKSEIYSEDVKRSFESVVRNNELKGKKVLITGASGLVGSFLTDVLIYAGCEVCPAGRRIEKLKERFPSTAPLYYDLTKPIVFDEDFDYVIHGAGYGHPGAFNEDPVGILVNAVVGANGLLKYSLMHKVKRFLYISSGEVYGGIESMNSRACYPLGKQAAENLCASYHKQYDLDIVVARLCHTFGPGIMEYDNRATAQFFRNAIKGEDIVLKSKGEQLRSYLYVADSASAILSVMTSGKAGEAYDIAAEGCTITIADLAKLIADIAGVMVRFEIQTGEELKQQSPIKTQVMDVNRLEELTWNKAFAVDEGIKRMINMDAR